MASRSFCHRRLRAAGDRAFCTGIDVTEGPWWSDQNEWNQEDPGVMLGPKQHRVWKPVITAVHGMAAGGAMYFINESDIVICSEDATFALPEVKNLAVIPGSGGVSRLTRLIGPHWARWPGHWACKTI